MTVVNKIVKEIENKANNWNDEKEVHFCTIWSVFNAHKLELLKEVQMKVQKKGITILGG